MEKSNKINWKTALEASSDLSTDELNELHESIINSIDWTGCRRWRMNQIMIMILSSLKSLHEDELTDGADREDMDDIL